MQPLYLFGKTCVQPFVKVLFPTQVIGKKRKKKLAPVILTPNHLHGMDVLLVGVNHLYQMHVLAKKEFYKTKFLAWVMRHIGVVGIDRGKPDLKAIKDVMKYLKSNKTVCIFPEGTRNKSDDRLQPIESGTSMFAIKAQTPIVPIAIYRHAKKFRKNFILIGDPYELTDFYGERINSETLKKADAVVLSKMLDTKRLLDFYVSLKGKERRAVKKELKDPCVPFESLVRKYEPRFFVPEYSAQAQTVEILQTAKAAAAQSTQALGE